MPPVSRILSLGVSSFSATIVISSITTNINVYSLAITAGWNAVLPAQIILNINDSVYSTSTATPALVASGFPTGSKIYINIASGKYVGGAGGLGGTMNVYPYNGLAGGTAIYTRNSTIITNLGTIGGGGGGGGSGGNNDDPSLGGGGGGGGIGGGLGGSGYAGYLGSGDSGTAGTYVAAGVGGVGAFATEPTVYTIQAGSGGNGGTWGAAGTSGSGPSGAWVGDVSFPYGSIPPGSGGAAGSAIDGSSYVTLKTAGTISGTQIN